MQVDDDFFLVEEWQQPEERTIDNRLVLPAAGRVPTDPGYTLTWREYPYPGGSLETAQTRTGHVLALAPPAGSVWVVPDERREREGYAVVVHNVTAAGADQAVRRVGHPEDYLSTSEWQRAGRLPR